MAVSTTPPAAMLSKKLLREGVRPEPAASATSGITMEAVNAAAVKPVTAFSLKDASTLSMPLDFGFTKAAFFDGLTGTDLNSDAELDWFSPFWVADISGIAIEAEAISFGAS